jgi:DNA invertase Pin-like site-specific DNA recombinase
MLSTNQYCAYLRKSRSDRDAEQRGEEETLARHRRILNEYATQTGMKISRFYCEVVSGDTIADRPVMQELLRDVESGMWAAVLVIEIERLARGNTKDQGIVADAFKYSGTKIITLSKTYDPDNEFDEEYFEFGLFMSRREYKTISRRLQRGRIASVKEGNFVGGTAPYGYRKIRNSDHKGYTLEIIPEQADVVRMIFDWYCNGDAAADGSVTNMGAPTIAARLDLLGIKPVMKNKWSASTIRDMLKNEFYIGNVVFGKQKEVKSSINGDIKKVRKSSEDYIAVPGKHPAIITPELFATARKMLAANRKNTLPSSAVLRNPLSGLVYCEKCGQMMTRLAPNSRNKYATLKCPNRYCDNVSAPMFLIERMVLSFLSDWVKSYESTADAAAKRPMEDRVEDKKKLVARLTAELATLQMQMDKTYTLLEQGVYSIDVFQHRQTSIKNDIAALEQSRKMLEDELTQISKAQLERDAVIPKIQHLLDAYPTNTAAENNRILKEVIEKILYSKDDPNTRGKLENTNFSLGIFPRVTKST